MYYKVLGIGYYWGSDLKRCDVEFPFNLLFYGILAIVGLVVFTRLILPQLEEKYEGITKLWYGFWSVVGALLMIMELLTECVK